MTDRDKHSANYDMAKITTLKMFIEQGQKSIKDPCKPWQNINFIVMFVINVWIVISQQGNNDKIEKYPQLKALNIKWSAC